MRTHKIIGKKIKWDGSKRFERFDIVDGESISADDGTNETDIMGRGMQFPIYRCNICGQEYGMSQANERGQHEVCA